MPILASKTYKFLNKWTSSDYIPDLLTQLNETLTKIPWLDASAVCRSWHLIIRCGIAWVDRLTVKGQIPENPEGAQGGVIGRAVSPKFGVMDWKLRKPCCFEIPVCVGSWSHKLSPRLWVSRKFRKGESAEWEGGYRPTIEFLVLGGCVCANREIQGSGESVFLHAGMSHGHFKISSCCFLTLIFIVRFYYKG